MRHTRVTAQLPVTAHIVQVPHALAGQHGHGARLRGCEVPLHGGLVRFDPVVRVVVALKNLDGDAWGEGCSNLCDHHDRVVVEAISGGPCMFGRQSMMNTMGVGVTRAIAKATNDCIWQLPLNPKFSRGGC